MKGIGWGAEEFLSFDSKAVSVLQAQGNACSFVVITDHPPKSPVIQQFLTGRISKPVPSSRRSSSRISPLQIHSPLPHLNFVIHNPNKEKAVCLKQAR
jgi:hypothetical protein